VWGFGPTLALSLSLFASTARADFADHFARRTDIPLNKAPVRGHSRALIIPIEVAGHPTVDVNELNAFFGDGGIFPHYFDVASHGQFHVDVTVAPVVHYDTCPLPAEFTNCAVPRGDTDALGPALDVLRDAIRRTHDDGGIRYTDFDINGINQTPDGTVDGLLLLTNTTFGGIALPIAQLNSGDNLDGGTGGTFLMDGVLLPYISIAGTKEILLHEFGHQLGLTDLYDQDSYEGGLDLSLMGNWRYDDKPDLLDAESRYRMSWAHTVHITQPMTVDLPPAEANGGFIIRVGGDTEYFLLENRGPGPTNQPVVDQILSHRGVAIYHVDWSVGPSPDEGAFVDRLIDCVTCNEYHPFILNLPEPGHPYRWLADGGSYVYEDELYVDGDSVGPDTSGQAFSATHPAISTNWYTNQSSGITFTVVGHTGDTFQVKIDQPASTCTEPRPCPAENVCPDETCTLPGSQSDGGPNTDSKKGCGCQSSDGLFGLIGLLVAALGLRRRPGVTSS
jgi:M6 family metalloprotease-like protein/MYXO-CTERM domain-containing protein